MDQYTGRTRMTAILCFLFLAVIQSQIVVQAGEEYFIDILVVSDAPLFDSWMSRAQPRPGETTREKALSNIRRYFTLVINEVNARFRTLERYNNFRLTVRPVGFVIAENTRDSVWTEREREAGNTQVDARRVLRNLGQWVATATDLPDHDHAMLFTGYDLVTDDAGVLFRYTVGRAVVGSLCEGGGRSVSVVEDRGAFQSVHTAAHELAHSLGALHDGTGNQCQPRDRYIMAGGTHPVTLANLRNPWFFSPCSAQEIATFVTQILDSRSNRQCLLRALPQRNVPDVEDIVPGQLFGPHEQCQHIYGPRSRYCFGGNFGQLEDICTSMFCLDPSDGRSNFCVRHHAARGTSCGNGKWCVEGKCVASGDAPDLLDTCPLGDALVSINGLQCPRAVTARPALCYDTQVQRICCGSCRALTGPSTTRSCPFGDRWRGCRADLCDTVWPDGTVYAAQCCRTCRFDPARWSCADEPEVDGLPCQDAVWRGGVQGCYNVTLAFLCCNTCRRLRDVRHPSGCEYGDLVPSTCRAARADRDLCGLSLRQQCCATCGDNDVAGRGTQVRSLVVTVYTAVLMSLLIFTIGR